MATITHRVGLGRNLTAAEVDANFDSLNADLTALAAIVAALGGGVTPAPGTVQLTASSYSVGEGGGTVTISVSRVGGSAGVASVAYATSNGTATSGSDYTATSGVLNWAAGDASPKTFNVPILQDSAVEGNETFNVTLSGATGASLGSPSSAVVTIVDDDVAPTVPGPVAGVTAGSPTSTTQPLTWTAASGATSYNVGYRLTSAGGAYTNGPQGVSGTSATVTGLAASTAYDYQVTPVNSVGSGTVGTLGNASTAGAAATVPGAPTSVVATPNAASASVAFTAPGSNGGSAITGYVVTASTGQTASGSASPINVTGLANGTAVTFTVHAVNGVGNSAESAASAAVTPVAAPTTRARWAMGTAAADVPTMFASATLAAGSPSTDRTGTITATSSPTLFTYAFVLASAAGSGMRFFDGTGYGGFDGYGAASVVSGAGADPTTLHGTVTDGSGNVFNVYRGNGHSNTATFTLS